LQRFFFLLLCARERTEKLIGELLCTDTSRVYLA